MNHGHHVVRVRAAKKIPWVRMELSIVDVSAEMRTRMLDCHRHITCIPIDQALFARSIFCVAFTLPVFEQTLPLPLQTAWRRHPWESNHDEHRANAYPNGEQWLVHLHVVASGDRVVLGELCRHWTHCFFTCWSRRTAQQVETLQYEVAYSVATKKLRDFAPTT